MSLTKSDASIRSTPEFDEKHVWDEIPLGFPGGDLWHSVRALVDASSPNTSVTLELSHLVSGGFVHEDGAEFWVPDPRIPVVVLTEGKSDARLLRLALNTLLPEYAAYLRFLDYDFARAAGGVGEVVRFVKMFAGSGITNRIVALFDNDTAGHQALNELGRLPANVFPICLPSRSEFRHYPSIGPDSEGVSDIDGQACSLELYLGREVLSDSNGRLRPVRWTGYNEKLGRCQGEVSAKSEVQSRFEEIVTLVRQEPRERERYDFSSVEAIFDAMFSALASR
jgi:hypothetical protein